MRNLQWLFLILITVLMLNGCNDKKNEAGNPKFIRARKFYEQDNYKEAVEAFNAYLMINPESVKAHRYLADLYNDHMEEPLNAIYHYRQILVLDPMSPEKEVIGKFLQSAEAKYYKKLEERYADEGDIGVLQKELDSMKLKAVKYYRVAVKLNNTNKTLKAELAQKNVQLKKLEQQVVDLKRAVASRPEPQPVEARPNPAARATTTPRQVQQDTSRSRATVPQRTQTQPSTPQARPRTLPSTYVIKQGDTLSKISQKMYGSSRYAVKIFQANKNVIPTLSRLRVGQKIVIPKLK